MKIEGVCHCEPQEVTAKCVSCWAYIRRGNKEFSWSYFHHNGRLICALNLKAFVRAIAHREWRAVKNMCHVLIFDRPKLAWSRDWTDWKDGPPSS